MGMPEEVLTKAINEGVDFEELIIQPTLLSTDKLYEIAVNVFSKAKQEIASHPSDENKENIAKLLRAYVVLKKSKDPTSPLSQQKGPIGKFFSKSLRQHEQRIAEAEKMFEKHFPSYIEAKHTLNIDSDLEKKFSHHIEEIELTLKELGIGNHEWSELKKALIHGDNKEATRLWHVIHAKVRVDASVTIFPNLAEVEKFLFGEKSLAPFVKNKIFEQLEREQLPIEDPTVLKEWIKLKVSIVKGKEKDFDKRVEAFASLKDSVTFLRQEQGASVLSKKPTKPDPLFTRKKAVEGDFFSKIENAAKFAKTEIFPRASKKGEIGKDLIENLQKAKQIVNPKAEQGALPIRGWIPIKDGKDSDLMYIDQDKGIIAFLDTNNTTTHLRTGINSDGQVEVAGYNNLLNFFRVDKEKLASPQFLQNLRHEESNNFKGAIINYLHGEQLPYPDPEKSPHLLINADIELTPQVLANKMLLIEAVDSGAIKPADEEALFLRSLFFDNLDAFIHQKQSPSLSTPMTNERPALIAQARELHNKGFLSMQELNHAVNVFRYYDEKPAKKANTKPETIIAVGRPGELPTLDAPKAPNVKVPLPKSVQSSTVPTSVSAALRPQLIKEILIPTTTFNAEKCLELCSDVKTFQKGLEALQAECKRLEKEKEDFGKRDLKLNYTALIQEAVSLSLPMPGSPIWKELDQLTEEQRTAVCKTLKSIATILCSGFPDSSGSLVKDPVVEEECSSMQLLNCTLLSYANWQLAASTPEGKEIMSDIPFSFVTYYKSAETGMLLTNPVIRERALQLFEMGLKDVETLKQIVGGNNILLNIGTEYDRVAHNVGRYIVQKNESIRKEFNERYDKIKKDNKHDNFKEKLDEDDYADLCLHYLWDYKEHLPIKLCEPIEESVSLCQEIRINGRYLHYNNKFLFYNAYLSPHFSRFPTTFNQEKNVYTITPFATDLRRQSHNSFSKRHPESLQGEEKFQLGQTPSANEVALAPVFYSTRSQPIKNLSPVLKLTTTEQKELAAIGTDPERAITGVFGFIKMHRNTLAEDSIFKILMYRLFEVGNIEQLFSHPNSESILSHEIPKILKETVDKLEQTLNDLDTSEEAKGTTALALSNLLALAENFKYFLSEKGYSVGNYPDFKKEYMRLLGPGLQVNPPLFPYAKRFLSLFNEERLEMATKEEVEAIFHFIQKARFSDGVMMDQFWDIPTSPAIRKWLLEQFKDPEQQIAFVRAAILNYLEQKHPNMNQETFNETFDIRWENEEILLVNTKTKQSLFFSDPITHRGNFELPLETLPDVLKGIGIPLAAAGSPWYRSDANLQKAFEPLLQESLSKYTVIPPSGEGDRYKIDGTPFSFDEEKGFYQKVVDPADNTSKLDLLWIKGKSLDQLPPAINEFLKHALAKHPDAEYFVNPQNHVLYLVDQGVPLYAISQDKKLYLQRCSDGAIAWDSQDLENPMRELCNRFDAILWWKKEPGGQLKPATLETKNENIAWHLKNSKGDIVLENAAHPDFFLMDPDTLSPEIAKEPLFEAFLRNGKGRLFKNAQGEYLLYIKDTTQPDGWLKVDFKAGKVSTEDPRDLFNWAAMNRELSLVQLVCKQLKIENRNDWKRDSFLKEAKDLYEHLSGSSANSRDAGLALMLHNLRVEHDGKNLYSKEDPSVNNLIRIYRTYKGQRSSRISNEDERLFLHSLRTMIALNEQKLKNVDTEPPLPFSKEFLEQLIFPTDALSNLRRTYHTQVAPITEDRLQQLQKGTTPKERWIALEESSMDQDASKLWRNPVVKFFSGERETMLKKIRFFKDLDLEKTDEENVLSVLGMKDANEEFGISWQKLKKEINKNTVAKGKFVDDHFWVFYTLLKEKSATHAEVSEMLEWLQFSSVVTNEMKLLIQLANGGDSFPSLSDLVKMERRNQTQLNTLAEQWSELEKARYKGLSLLNTAINMMDAGAREKNRKYSIHDYNKIEWPSKKDKDEAIRISRKIRLQEKEIGSILKDTLENTIETLKAKQFKAFKTAFPSDISLWKIVKGCFSFIADAISLYRKSRIDATHITQTSAIRSYFSYKIKAVSSGAADALEKVSEKLNGKISTLKGTLFSKDPSEFEPNKLTTNVIRSWDKKITNLEKSLERKQAKLLRLANKAADTKGALKQMDKNKKIDWDQLTKLVYKGQIHAYEKHLADPSAYQRIEQKYYEFLISLSHYHQIKNISATMKGLIHEKEDPLLTNKLKTLLDQKRAYAPDDPKNRHLLFLEAASPNGMYNANQIKMREDAELNDKQLVVLAKMPTGFGKTDYVIPDFNEATIANSPNASPQALSRLLKVSPSKYIIKRDDTPIGVTLKRLMLNIWPTAIAKINKETIALKRWFAFKKDVVGYTYSRNATVLELEQKILELEKAQQKGTPISTTASEISSTTLRMWEVCEKCHAAPDNIEFRRELSAYLHILCILYGNTTSTIDEAHEVLDPMQQSIIALTKHKETLPNWSANYGIKFFGLLLENDEFRAFLEKNEKPAPDEIAGLVQKFITPQLITAIRTDLGIPASEHDDFIKFVWEGGKLPQSTPKNQVRYAHLAKGYLVSVFEAMLNGAVNIDFGRSHSHHDKVKGAIPYEKKDTPKEDPNAPYPHLLKNPDESLFKSLRTLHFEGLDKNDLLELIIELEARYKKEKQDNPKIKGAQSASYQALKDISEKAGLDKKLIGEQNLPFLNYLVKEGPKGQAIKKALETVSKDSPVWKDPAVVNSYAQHFVVSSILIFPDSISFSPQELIHMLPQSLSTTATPQPTETLSKSAHYKELTSINEEARATLMKKIADIKPMPQTTEEMAKNISVAAKERKARAVIDITAQVKVDNVTFAKMIANHIAKDPSHSIQYISYFDTLTKRFVRMEVPTTHAKSSPSLENTLTLYDQATSTGTNIAQMKDALGIVLLGDAATDDQFSQGSGRMRQLRAGQAIEAWTSQYADGTLKEKKEHLEQRLKKNQTDTLKEKNKRAFQHMMQGEIKGTMLMHVLGIPLEGASSEKGAQTLKQPNVDNALGYYTKYRNYILNHEPYDPVKSYQNIGKSNTAAENLAKAQKEYKTTSDIYFSRSVSAQVKKNLDKYPPLWKNVPLSDRDYDVNAGAALEVSSETQTEAQTQTQAQAQINLDLNQSIESSRLPESGEYEKPRDWPKATALFNDKLDDDKINHLLSLYTQLDECERKISSVLDNKITQLSTALDRFDEFNPLKLWYASIKTVVTIISATVNQLYQEWSLKKQRDQIKGRIDLLEGFVKNNVYFLDARSVIERQMSRFSVPKEKIALTFFTSNFSISTNYSPQLSKKPARVFQFNEKSSKLKQLQYLMLIEEDGHYKAVAIDGTDEQELRKLLEINRNNEDPSKRKIAIYDLNSDLIVDYGKEKMDNTVLNNKEVQNLIVQGKVLAGHMIPPASPYRDALMSKITSLEKESEKENLNAFIHLHNAFVAADQDHKEDYLWLGGVDI